MKCELCHRPAKSKSSQLCGAHDQQRRRAGMPLLDFLSAIKRGEQPGRKVHACAECGTEFQGTGNNQVTTCSEACATARRRRRSRDSKKRTYHADIEAARQKAKQKRKENPEFYREMDRRKLQRQWKANPTFCLECGAETTGPHIGRKYCCVACRDMARKRQKQVKQETNSSLALLALSNRPDKAKGRTKRYQVNCVTCGKMFASVTGLAKYCGSGCRPVNPTKQPKSYQCAVCGTTFTSSASHAKYCSERCGKDAINAGMRSKATSKKIDRQCVVCKADFIGRKNATCCSKDCRAEHHRMESRARAQASDVKTRNKLLARLRHNVKLECKICGLDLSHLPDLRTNRYTCSLECKDEAKRQRAKRSYENRKQRHHQPDN